MNRNSTKFLPPAALALVAALMAGCASDNLFAEDDVYKPNSGSQLHPIKLVNGRAVVEKCGDWPEDMGDTTRNELASNHGCAVQSNIAAMAAQPGHLVGKSKPLPRPLGDVQYTAIKKLEAPASAGQAQ